MKYFKVYKGTNWTHQEVSKEEARKTLEGHYKKEALDDIFDNERGFRLETPFAIVWTQTAEGLVPMAGFYGIVG